MSSFQYVESWGGDMVLGDPMMWPARVRVGNSGLRKWESALNRHHLGPVAGVDEAGRGACAGPLVVAACILPQAPVRDLQELNDSKKLSPKKREILFPVIKREAVSWSVIVISAEDIDRDGVHRANIEGMRRAVAALMHTPGYVLSDGFSVPGLPIPSLPMIGGDGNAACIAAASVLAKVTRDHGMVELDTEFPGYGFAGHKGYGTRAHQEALVSLGPCPEHRLSYANVQRAIYQGSAQTRQQLQEQTGKEDLALF